MVKVLGWYDNEWGYSNRLVDLVAFIGDAADARGYAARSSLPRLEDLPLGARRRACSCASTSTSRCATAQVEDDLRITTALPTLEWLREHDAAVVVAAVTSAGRRAARPAVLDGAGGARGSASCSARDVPARAARSSGATVERDAPRASTPGERR